MCGHELSGNSVRYGWNSVILKRSGKKSVCDKSVARKKNTNIHTADGWILKGLGKYNLVDTHKFIFAHIPVIIVLVFTHLPALQTGEFVWIAYTAFILFSTWCWHIIKIHNTKIISIFFSQSLSLSHSLSLSLCCSSFVLYLYIVAGSTVAFVCVCIAKCRCKALGSA